MFEPSLVAEKFTLQNATATSLNLVVATSQEDDEGDILKALNLPSGSRKKYKKRWIEFDCQNGVHHGKWATYENKTRVRVKGGYIGRFNLVAELGNYGRKRVQEFPYTHNCHYPERFQKDLEECGVTGIAVQGWPSGRSISRISGSKRSSGDE